MKILRNICCALLALLMLSACKSDDNLSSVPEGLPVTLRLSLAVPEAAAVHNMRATDAQETAVERVALLFYKKSQPDEPPVVVEITDMGTPQQLTNTNYKYTVNVNADKLYSGEWYLYAVANYDKNFVSVTLDQLKNMTKAQMDEFCTSGSSELDIVETAVLMSGKYENENPDGTLTLKPGENELVGDPCLVLRRTIAKSIFNFVNGTGVTFTPTSYSLYNYSTSSTLMERTGWEGSEGTQPGSLTYKANESTLLTKENIPISGESFTFYTQENVQQPKTTGCSQQSNRESYSDNNRGAHPRTNFTYAPDNATYVVVKGHYEGPRSQTDKTSVVGDVEYTIHLGDFSQSGSNDNFTMRRNVKYTYKVTVNGVNNIVVEATAENEAQPGAEGNIMNANSAVSVRLDAHYEQVLLPLDISSNLSSFSLSIKTPYNTAQTVFNSADALTDNVDYKWVEFGKPASASTFQSYSTLKTGNKLCNIKELLEKLKDINNSANQEYFLVQDGKVYVAAYVNEYYYDGKDILGFVNADDREMTLSSGTSVSADKHSSYTVTPIFSLQQRSIKSPMKLSLANPFGIETVEEESDQKPITANAIDPQKSSGTDSGYGWQNFKNVFGSNAQWSTYIDEAHNGWINGVHGTGMNSNYDYALYRVLSRNRDNNGDGIIGDDEIRWYLPAQQQCLVIWYGENSLPVETRFDVSDRTSKTYLTSSANNYNRTWWVDEGVAFGEWKSDRGDIEKLNAVRAIRSLEDVDGETTKISSWDSSTRTITIDGLSDECLRTEEIKGNYSAHNSGDYEDRLPRAFRLASSTISTTAATAATSNTILSTFDNGESATLGHWRVPNEKELGLMRERVTLTQNTTARTTYQNTRYYFIQSGGFISTDTSVGGDSDMEVLPVIDATPSASAVKQYDGSYSNSGKGFGVSKSKRKKSKRR